MSFEFRSEAQRIAIERAVAFVVEMRSLAQTAPQGHILHACEAQALDAGRDLLHATLQQAVPHRIEHAQKKGATLAPVRAPVRSASSDAASGKS